VECREEERTRESDKKEERLKKNMRNVQKEK
jgi:hypothetical protein